MHVERADLTLVTRFHMLRSCVWVRDVLTVCCDCALSLSRSLQRRT